MQAYFEYDEIKKVARQKFVIMSQVNSSNILNTFNNVRINACSDHVRAVVRHSNQKHEFDLKQAEYMQGALISR